MIKHLFLSRLFVASLTLAVPGCGVFKKKSPDEAAASQPPIPPKDMSPEEAKEVLNDVANDWFYGSGLGTTALNVGAIFLFPPYAAYVLGNAALGYAGYEELYVSKLLPKEEEKHFNEGYNNVVSGPGRLTAAIAGEEFRTQERIRGKYSGKPNRRISSLHGNDWTRYKRTN